MSTLVAYKYSGTIIGLRVGSSNIKASNFKDFNIDTNKLSSLGIDSVDVKVIGQNGNIKTYMDEFGKQVFWVDVKSLKQFTDAVKDVNDLGLTSLDSDYIYIRHFSAGNLIDLVDNNELSSYWSCLTRTYAAVDVKGNVRALVRRAGCDFNHSDKFTINMIEVIEKKQNWGTRVVNQLLDNFGLVSGLAISSSEGFWKTFKNAEFDGSKFIIKKE